MSIPIKYEKRDSIAFIAMNRPEKRNALSIDMANDFVDALKEAEKDPEVKAVIISGEGKIFSAGGDLEVLHTLNNSAKIMEYMKQALAVIQTIRELDKYVISAVHGFAAGAGFSIAVAADFVVAKKDAAFVCSFTNVGIIPDLGLLKELTDNLPNAVVKEWISSGRPIAAEEAYHRGMVNHVTEEDVVEAAIHYAAFIIDGPPLANKFVKHMVNHADEWSSGTNDLQETAVQTLLLQSEDNKKGIQAFFEKRKPDFKGR
ncbi:enoyl-CoA hydratase/isomerase family protein [Oceanobacillus jeddahense]|uniref:Enoyl-CoA hydratase/isomerase family protein n=1 Tax=Oceanobacillus jeddahense TaxID=1462527 RepID=A0ABY5JPL2_9BACI|nr:enoyl-CoA hydratase/isomerase family protein [Oceanobacillus jeddahense]UUI02240.1 enoyl-CoA hydratase/isomerase family protein [Oceanobacillus jeddahense]